MHWFQILAATSLTDVDTKLPHDEPVVEDAEISSGVLISFNVHFIGAKSKIRLFQQNLVWFPDLLGDSMGTVQWGYGTVRYEMIKGQSIIAVNCVPKHGAQDCVPTLTIKISFYMFGNSFTV